LIGLDWSVSGYGPVEGSCERGNEHSKVKISLLQAMDAHRVARGYGSHITYTNDK
jgi:hypothetical protein